MVNVEKVASHLDTDTMTLEDSTLSAYCQRLVNHINSNPSYTLIRQNQITIAGNAACQIEWKDADSYDFETYTIVDGKLFTFAYSDNQLSVPETFPLANKMVESFQIKTE